MRKTRSDAVLLNLPEEQQAKLAEWLLAGTPYHEAKVLVEKEFGVTVKSLNSFSSFWRDVCQPHLLARRRKAASAAEERATEVRKEGSNAFDVATMDAIKQKAYELAENPEAHPRDVKAVLMLVLKARDQDLQERRIELLEKKAQEADRARAVTQSALSAEEKAAKMREIFGM